MAMYNSGMLTRLIVCLGVLLVVAGCRSREVEKDLALTDIHTGWYDLGLVEGQHVRLELNSLGRGFHLCRTALLILDTNKHIVIIH